MQIKSVIIENFRGYQTRQTIAFDQLTAFVGKNDVGKSTILEALDIFFNDGAGPISLDVRDVNVDAKNAANGANVDVIIGVEFSEVPDYVVLDDNNQTFLADEYLLNSEDSLTIIKHYPNAGKPKVFIYANHPSHPDCCALLHKKQTELRKLTIDIDCDHNKNAEMRKALRQQHVNELNLQMQEIDVSKEDAKNIWEKLRNYLPVYCLFQSDRSNGDKDKEVQDPLKEAIKIIFSKQEIKEKCKEIYSAVINELEDVSSRTLNKLNEMNSHLASTLHPTMPSSDALKWIDVFKNVSITGDNDIPINKRGSGVKRMILLNFFRAEAERSQAERKAPGIIYAIEEPETAQHIVHQQIMVKSLKELASHDSTQVVITTHSSVILKCLSFSEIRLIQDSPEGKVVETVSPSQLPYPSLNEIAYTNFGEVSEEYHDELYGHLEYENWLNDYKQGKRQFSYNQLKRDGTLMVKQLTKTEIIRHQVHHPENQHNTRFTQEELAQSISDMRQFIEGKNLGRVL